MKLKPFKSDGCSGVKWILPGLARRIADLCYEHDGGAPGTFRSREGDVADAAPGTYYRGGDELQRLRRDVDFVLRLAEREGAFWARLFFLGVSIGGVPWLPLPWRWGFGRGLKPSGYDRRGMLRRSRPGE